MKSISLCVCQGKGYILGVILCMEHKLQGKKVKRSQDGENPYKDIFDELIQN